MHSMVAFARILRLQGQGFHGSTGSVARWRQKTVGIHSTLNELTLETGWPKLMPRVVACELEHVK
jgi:hypothetical protein